MDVRPHRRASDTDRVIVSQTRSDLAVHSGETPGYHRILVALDGSASSLLALSTALAIASPRSASLVLLGVSPDVEQSEPWVAEAAPPEQLQRDADRELQTKLDHAAALVPGKVAAAVLLRHGHAGPAILEVAAEARCDAIAMGARGVGRIGAALGSVSQYVLHRAEIPVIVAHRPEHASPEVPR
jgi:nucleotide-binding universal stress UspA family protein